MPYLFSDEVQYAGQFRVLGGDFYHPRLGDTQSDDFKHKAARYQKMVSADTGGATLLRKKVDEGVRVGNQGGFCE